MEYDVQDQGIPGTPVRALNPNLVIFIRPDSKMQSLRVGLMKYILYSNKLF